MADSRYVIIPVLPLILSVGGVSGIGCTLGGRKKKIHGNGDLLPVWGALEPLNIPPDTLSHRLYLIVTI